MTLIQSHALHHVTLVGADRQTSMDFWTKIMGMPFVFEQPNLDNPDEGHLYFDPGDGRLITVFTDETRAATKNHTSTEPGCVHHLAFNIAKSDLDQAVDRLDAHGLAHSGIKDRGFMQSIYFRDPLGLLIELACYIFEPPKGITHADVLRRAYEIRVEKGDSSIDVDHLTQATQALKTSADLGET